MDFTWALVFIPILLEMAPEEVEGFNCLELPNSLEAKSFMKMVSLKPHLVNRTPSNLLREVSLNESVRFCLYTSQNKYDTVPLFNGDTRSLKSSALNMEIPTKIIIHGYFNSLDSASIQDIKNSFFGAGDYNVIGVDWGDIADTVFYHMAAEQTEDVGLFVGSFIRFLIDQGVKPSDIHLIGHSLGAHVAGFAGASLKPIKVARISGLDPAKPCFHNSLPELRLDSTDAEFVDCIHTCGDYLSLLEPICQADFYPNGGIDTQPGCLLITAGICSHGRAHDYFAESITPGHTFQTMKCSKIPTDNLDSCQHSTNLMGYAASPSMSGIFYSATKDAYPFSFSDSQK